MEVPRLCKNGAVKIRPELGGALASRRRVSRRQCSPPVCARSNAKLHAARDGRGSKPPLAGTACPARLRRSVVLVAVPADRAEAERRAGCKLGRLHGGREDVQGSDVWLELTGAPPCRGVGVRRGPRAWSVLQIPSTPGCLGAVRCGVDLHFAGGSGGQHSSLAAAESAPLAARPEDRAVQVFDVTAFLWRAFELFFVAGSSDRLLYMRVFAEICMQLLKSLRPS